MQELKKDLVNAILLGFAVMVLYVVGLGIQTIAEAVLHPNIVSLIK